MTRRQFRMVLAVCFLVMACYVAACMAAAGQNPLLTTAGAAALFSPLLLSLLNEPD